MRPRRQGRRVRLLYHFGPEFDGFSAGGVWEDARLGLRDLRVFECCAIVSDIGWIPESSCLVGAMIPRPVRVFGSRDWEAALTRLTSPPGDGGIRHRLLPESGVVVIEPTGPLRKEDFDALVPIVDPWIEAHGELRGMVVHGRAFSGWENLVSLFRHLTFVRDHHRRLRRMAVYADGTLATLAPRLPSTSRRRSSSISVTTRSTGPSRGRRLVAGRRAESE